MTNIQTIPSYKYKIKKKIDMMPFAEYRLAKRMLPRMLGINKRTFEKYMYTKVSDPYEMPAGHIALLAKFFKCPIEDMFSQMPKPNSLASLIQQDRKEIALQLNLKK